MAAKDDELTPAERRLAAEIRRLRETEGWTQTELAARVQRLNLPHVNQTAISRIEKGTRPVRLVEAQAIAKVFGRSIRALQDPSGLESDLEATERMTSETAEVRAAYVAARKRLWALASQLQGQLDRLDLPGLLDMDKEDMDRVIETRVDAGEQLDWIYQHFPEQRPAGWHRRPMRHDDDDA